ncbi:transglutaminase domain-containing protein [Candidatus Woesearchaeota archaeon]|nr:transglutaminase domain-containing protein [Candidatus Woesearchaeota archaeon]
MEHTSYHQLDFETIPTQPGPWRTILAILLALLIILMIIPFYAIKVNPEPKNLPTVEEVLQGLDLQQTNRTSMVYSDFPLLALQASNDQVIKTVADRIVTQGCTHARGETRRVCHAKALFYLVRDDFNYVADPASFEYIKTARESLLSQGGDCDDASLLLASLLEAVGIETRFVFIPRHVYVQVHLPEALKRYQDADGWVNLDATCQDCGFGEVTYGTAGARKTVIS